MKTPLFAAIALVAGLIAAGCGSDDAATPDDPKPDGSEPLADGGGAVVVADSGGETPRSDGGGEAPRSDGGAAEAGPSGPSVISDAAVPADGGGKSDAATMGTTTDAGDAATGATEARFSFFMTSQAGLERLSGKKDGFGGDLRFNKDDGLSGADEICRQLAEESMPNNGKTWRAFLSVTKGPNGAPVNAIDRIGEGPWYDRRERPFAMNKAALLNTRPAGADPIIVNDFPNEYGVPNHDPGTGIIDNHNTLTGSTTMGTLDQRGLSATCQDWTSAEADGGKPRCGVSWPRGMLQHWISALSEGGCKPGATPGNNAQSGTPGTVGALGGYGGFYCFALTP